MLDDLRGALASADADGSAAPRIRSSPTATRSARARSARWRGSSSSAASRRWRQAGGAPLDALAQEYARVAAALTELRNA